MLSTNAEKYLGAIYRMTEEREAATVSDLAERLAVSRVSANEMVRKLESRGLVAYTPYAGVALTKAGTAVAMDIVRRHRVWERFLVDVLQMPWDQAHEEACGLAHDTSPALLQRMAEFLGEPNTCPHGHAVPTAAGAITEEKGQPLGELPVGQQASVLRVPEDAPGMLTYLNQLGLRPDASVTIEEVAPFDGPLTVRVAGVQRVLGRRLASQIMVRVA